MQNNGGWWRRFVCWLTGQSSHARLLDIEEVGDVTVVKFLGKDLNSEDEVETIRGQLFALVTEDGRKRIVLDFLNIGGGGSAAIGMLFKLRNRLNWANGQLRLCNFQPVLNELFATTGDVVLRNLSPNFWPTGNLEAALKDF